MTDRLKKEQEAGSPKSRAAAVYEVLAVSLKLGLTSFGGPIAPGGTLFI